ncbi:MAG: OmpH family outer membrane protein [Aquificae bacterium]|nr:OmpH family outer membrane protein [Aquificota bacterium]
MKKVIFGLLVFLLALSGSFAKDIRNVKIAVVDVQKAMLESKEGKKAKKEMEQKISYYKKQIDNLQKKYEEIDKQLQSPVLSEAGKKKKLEEKKKIEEKLRNLQLQAAQELNKMKIEAEKKLVEKLKKAAERYAKRHGIDIILAKSPMAGIVYANPTIDITEQIIKEMNK